MTTELTLDYRLRYFDYDRFGRLTPTVILDLFQDVATLHANAMGISWDVMQEKGVFWAVVRLAYEVLEEPERGSFVSVRTWPRNPGGVSFQRDFQFLGEDGRLLITGTSEWVLMSTETRKLVKLRDYYCADEMQYVEEAAWPTKLSKIPDPAEAPLLQSERLLSFADSDINGHINNTRYPGYVLDAINSASELPIRRLQMDYRTELHPDNLLVTEVVGGAHSGEIVATGKNEQGEVAFRCRLELASPEELPGAIWNKVQ